MMSSAGSRISVISSIPFTFWDADLIHADQCRTTQDLQPGTALRHCYGPQVGECVTSLRQRQLSEQYAFSCRCTACTDPKQPFREACQVGLRCPMPAPQAGDVSAAAISLQPADQATVRMPGRASQEQDCCGGPIIARADLTPGICSLQAGCQGGKAMCLGCGMNFSWPASCSIQYYVGDAAYVEQPAPWDIHASLKCQGLMRPPQIAHHMPMKEFWESQSWEMEKPAAKVMQQTVGLQQLVAAARTSIPGNLHAMASLENVKECIQMCQEPHDKA